MSKQLKLTDLYAVFEDRFKQTTTYETRFPADSRWSLVVSPSTKEIFFTDYYETEEISLKPQPFIILADNERIELQGEVVKQEQKTETHKVYDGGERVKKVVPQLDFNGNIEKYRTEYNYVEKSHFEQSNYMAYKISYTVPTLELRKIASATKIECLLNNVELRLEECQPIQHAAKTLCYLLGDQNYVKDLEAIVDAHNKKESEKEKKERREKALKQQKQNRLNALKQQYSVIDKLRVINFLFGIVCLLGTVVTYVGKEMNSDRYSGYGEYPNAESYMTWFILGFGLAICLAIFNICKIKSLEREASEIKL